VNVYNFIRFMSCFLLFLFFQLFLQVTSGAFTNEFGGSPDEAGHYVTGLMVRDYIASFQLNSPMRYAENYYIHYPKVALGHWPPFFYVVQTLWMLLFSSSRLSMIFLMAIITTLLSMTVFLVLKKELGSRLGIFSGLLVIAIPLVQQYSGMLMAETLVALLCLLGGIKFWKVLGY